MNLLPTVSARSGVHAESPPLKRWASLQLHDPVSPRPQRLKCGSLVPGDGIVDAELVALEGVAHRGVRPVAVAGQYPGIEPVGAIGLKRDGGVVDEDGPRRRGRRGHNAPSASRVGGRE